MKEWERENETLKLSGMGEVNGKKSPSEFCFLIFAFLKNIDEHFFVLVDTSEGF